MITKEQIHELTKKFKTNETVVLREYVQLLCLDKLYSMKGCEGIYFKGGTAIHIIFGAQRFSEDLDFTVDMKDEDFEDFIKAFFNVICKENSGFSFKEREIISGRTFLLTVKPDFIDYKVFIKFDFSFREKPLDPSKSTIKSDFPIIFNSYIHHLSKNEVMAEKVRAIMTREKGRDLYDIAYLLGAGAVFNSEMIAKKLKYYELDLKNKEEIYKRLDKFNEKEFIVDMKPFVAIGEREKLGEKFKYVVDFVKQNL
ncbi:MAG: nucleotidyl transferase AbiEii/AbiGii toxin family protein [bacterium]